MRRFVAFLLLLFCCIDLGFADDCAEDPGAIESQVVLMHTSDNAEPGENGHECFCCCRHIVPEPFFHVEPITSPPVPALSLKTQHPESSRRAIFHPPRA